MHERIHNLKCLLARIRLRDEELLDVDAKLACVLWVEGMLCVDECRNAAGLLRLGNHVQRDRRLARRLGTKHLDDASARNAANTKCDIERQDPRGDHLDVHVRLGFTKAHDRALAMRLLDVPQSILECLLTRHRLIGFCPLVLFCHLYLLVRFCERLFSLNYIKIPAPLSKKRMRGYVRKKIYFKWARTISLMSLPSARPFTRGMRTPITLPISFAVSAPTSATTSATIFFTSSTLS